MKKLAFILFITVLSACSPETEQTDLSSKLQKTEFANDSPALVVVNGEPISSADLDAAILRTVGEMGAFQLDGNGRKKVLESIVLSTIMAQKQMSAYSFDEQQEVERQVKAYRNELLAKRYLKQNVSPVPVTNAMVEDYYQKNPEKFGGKSLKVYQVLKGLTRLEGKVRENLLTEMQRVSSLNNWKKEVELLKQQGIQIEYSSGVAQEKTLNQKLMQIIASLEKGEVSSLHYLDGLPMMFKVVDIREIQPKPLSQVRGEIRKSLAPLQLKKAVRAVSDKLLAEANVEYQE